MPQRQRIAAYAVLLRGEGTDREVLLTRMSSRTRIEGRWTLPGGGIDHGEDPRDAVRREVAEETGLVVTVGPEVGAVRRPAPDGRVYDIRDHAAVPVGGTLRAGDDAADARWCDATEYAALDAAGELVPGLTDALRSWSCLPK